MTSACVMKWFNIHYFFKKKPFPEPHQKNWRLVQSCIKCRKSKIWTTLPILCTALIAFPRNAFMSNSFFSRQVRHDSTYTRPSNSFKCMRPKWDVGRDWFYLDRAQFKTSSNLKELDSLIRGSKNVCLIWAQAIQIKYKPSRYLPWIKDVVALPLSNDSH